MVHIVNNHDGWLWDEEMDWFISPTGRLADFPGAPFRGQLTNAEHQEIVESIGAIGAHPEVYYHKDSDTLEAVPDYDDGEEDVTTAEAEQLANDVENGQEPDSEVDVDGVHARTWVVGDITINIVDIV